MRAHSFDRHGARRWFWALLAIAALLRALAFNPWSAHHPDELFQYVEQAYRIVFGDGIVPWEYRFRIRNMAMPWLLAGPMALGRAIDPGGIAYLVLPRALIAGIGLVPVVAAWRIGRRHSPRHAIVAMAAMAVWTESVMFSVQTLSEIVAVAAFLAGAALFRRDATRWRIAAVGALMTAACVFRFQSGPALLAWALVAAGRDRRAWGWLAAGAIPVIATGGLFDLSGGQIPYTWIWRNYQFNIVAGRMKEIGGVSPWTYLLTWPQAWGIPSLLVIFLAIKGWRREPALVIAALANLVLHQFVGHKEQRYLLLTTQPLLIVAALGSVDLMRRWTLVRLVAAWAAASASLWLIPYYWVDFRENGARTRLARAVIADPAVCGLVIPGEEYFYFGRAMVQSSKPIYLLPTGGPPVTFDRPHPPRPAAPLRAANAMLDYAIEGPPAAPWVAGRCVGNDDHRLCAYRRPGGCDAIGQARPHLFQEQLDSRGM
ncbi:hypothetical protein ABDK56_07810 [Sphingomonas sp. ASV193]|uniref:hypothetical protein n=1 Tax=Sphingomonas sp. ASV193 TaxID=3144405 RepID=UPI0032E8D451